MPTPARVVTSIAGALLVGVGIASCTLDLAGLPAGPSPVSGAGGATTTATTSSGDLTASSATGTVNVSGTSGTSSASGTSVTASTSGASTTSSASSGGGPLCGNGLVEAGEACDDGNVELGDGCSPTCTVELLDACPGLLVPLSPPGVLVHGTLVGAQNDVAPSCGANQLDVIYTVIPSVSGTLKVTASSPLAKSLSIRSSCLDSPTAELRCDAGTNDVSSRQWVYAGVPYTVIVDGDAQAFSLHLELFACGDGTTQELEECDAPNDPTCVGCFRCAGPDEFSDPVSHHCYRHTPGQSKDWPSARADCLAWSGDLVGISSAAESSFLESKGFNAWTGGNDQAVECSYSWVNGEPWQPHWVSGKPNNQNDEDCAFLYNFGAMNDLQCTQQQEWLCERAPGGKCNDGIVQPGEECDDAISYAAITCQGCVVGCAAGEIKDPTTHHCYRVVTNGGGASWNAAQADCQSSGAYLATINSAVENALLAPEIAAPTWIGASRGGSFAWTNTDAFCFSSWGATEPTADGSKNCVAIQADGTWANDGCWQTKPYVCERDN